MRCFCCGFQTTVLHMKRLSQTESPIFVILCVLCFQMQSFFTSIFYVCQCMSLHVCLGDFFLFLNSRLAIFWKKLTFWLSACSVLIMVPLLKCVLLSLWCLGTEGVR